MPKKQDDKPAALDHVLYEIEMMTLALWTLRRPGGAQGREGSGWLEVFAIHARNLNEFFAEGSGYMEPRDFVPWSYDYERNDALVRRANSQIAHLTYDRERPEEKTDWPYKDYFNPLQEQSLKFLQAVVTVEPLMAYHHNRKRTEALLDLLPRIRFVEA